MPDSPDGLSPLPQAHGPSRLQLRPCTPATTPDVPVQGCVPILTEHIVRSRLANADQRTV